MRLVMLLGLGLLACGGEAGKTASPAGGGTPGAGGSAAGNHGLGSAPAAGGSEAAQAGAGAPSGGSDPTGGGGSGGAAQAGSAGTDGGPLAGSGGAGGSQSVEGGASGAAGAPDEQGGAGGEGGGAPPDDTGCIPRPADGNLGNPGQIAGYDCSSCSNASELGYTTPSLCGATSCGSEVKVADLPDDVLILLPPGSHGGCGAQACDENGTAVAYPGWIGQLMLALPAGGVRIDTDPFRRVVKRDIPLLECTEITTCERYGSVAKFGIVVLPDAPRGWVRIRRGQTDPCP